MTKDVELLLQGHQIELSKLVFALGELKHSIVNKSKYDDLPAWVNIELAVKLKGGCSLAHVKNSLFLQPCCGTNYKTIGGRKCWRLNDVIDWLEISDSDLKKYADKWKITLPERYKRRSA